MAAVGSKRLSGRPNVRAGKGNKNTSDRLSQVLPKNWDFDKEDLCLEFYKAFERGENYQKKNAEEKLNQQINQLFERATFLSERMFHKVKDEMNVNAQKMLLNISNLPVFKTIILVPKDDFLSKKMSVVYNEAYQMKSKFNDANFRIDFQFMKDSDDVNHSLLDSDGYILTYVNEARGEETVS